MNKTFDNSIISQDGNTLTILKNDKEIQNIINENFKFNNTITKIEIMIPMQTLNLSYFLSVKEIDSFGNTIDRLYIRKNPILKLGPNSNYLSRN